MSTSICLVPLPSPDSIALQVRDEAAAARLRRDRENFKHQGCRSLEKSLGWGQGSLPFIW